MIVLAALVVLAGSMAIKLWSAVSLMQHYAPGTELDTSRGRRLYWTARVTPLGIAGAILLLTCCTGIWWVALCGGLVFAFAVSAVASVLYNRFFRRETA